MADWEPKIWGERLQLLKQNCVEIYLLNLEPRERPVCCSVHRHLMKHNRFYVQAGRIIVETGTKSTVLMPGDALSIPPGVKHRFTVLIPSTVIEMTWAEEITEDIHRDDVGHVLAEYEKPLNRQT